MSEDLRNAADQPRASRSRARSAAACGLFALLLAAPWDARQAHAQAERPADDARGAQRTLDPAAGPHPFGANLFLGHFRGQRQDGLNPDYVVMPGDRVVVNTWGAIDINNVFVVDGQGNIFLPGIGPVRVADVRNADLTQVVREHIGRVYRANVGVYTNLVTASPVAVFVTGGVAQPGRYAGVPSDSVLFFLDQAGGIDPTLGSYRSISILRAGQPVAEIDLYDFILDGTLPAVQFADGDVILVRARGPVVAVEGEVASAALLELGAEPFTGADTLRIVPAAARATEVTVRGIRDGRALLTTLAVDEFRGFRLEDGDTVHFRDDGRPDTILVQLEGEFSGPSVLSVARGARLVDVLNHVEVDPDLADTRSVHLRRASVAEAQKKSIDDSLFRLERSALLALSSTDREASIRVKEAQLMQSFIESARLIQPLGRVVTTARGRQLNLLLQDGDIIVIPARSNLVRIGGEVQMSHAVVYSRGLRARDYIQRAGGYTDRSDKRRVIIHHASAEVTIASPSAYVLPGDEILVPPKIDRKWLQNVADVTQILYQIAVSAAVVLQVVN